MYLALMGRINRRVPLVLIVKTRKICRPLRPFPIARNRSSVLECMGSGNTANSPSNSASISSVETPCFWHLARLPLSQSNPVTVPFIPVHYTNVYTFQVKNRSASLRSIVPGMLRHRPDKGMTYKRILNGGQGRNRTTDTRIFSFTQPP